MYRPLRLRPGTAALAAVSFSSEVGCAADQTPAPDQSVERRSSGALSDFAGSDLVSDLTGSILVLSTWGVSTRADTSVREASAERGCSDRCSERARATARVISIRAPP